MTQLPQNKVVTNVALAIFVLFLGIISCNSPNPKEPSAPTPEVVKTEYKFEDDRLKVADSLRRKRKYAEAIKEYERVKGSFEEEENWEGVVYSYDRIGFSYLSQREDSASASNLMTARMLALEHLGEDHLLTVKAYLDDGIRSHFSRKFKQATAFLDTAGWLYSSAEAYDSTLLKAIIDYKYYTYRFARTSSDTSIKYLDLRKRFLESNGDIEIRDLFTLHRNYAAIYKQTGDYQRALAYVQEAVNLKIKHPDEISQSSYVAALFDLAAIYSDNFDFENSVEVSQELLIEARKVYDSDDQNWSEIYNVLASSLQGLENYRDAAVWYQKAVLNLELNNFGHDAYWSYQMNLGKCYSILGEEKKAEKFLFEALEGQTALSGKLNVKTAEKYFSIGDHYSTKGDHQLAINFYDSALLAASSGKLANLNETPQISQLEPSYLSLRSINLKIQELYKLGVSLDDISLMNTTLDYADLGHSILQFNRTKYDANEGKLFMSERFKSIYDIAISSSYRLYSKGDPSKRKEVLNDAVKFLSRSKSNLFLEQAGEFVNIKNPEVPKIVREEYFELIGKLEELDERFYRLTGEGATSDSIRLINSERMQVNASLASLRGSVDQFVLESGSLNDMDSLLMERIQTLLKEDENSILIEYFMTEDFIYSLGLSADDGILNRTAVDSVFLKAFYGYLEEVSKAPSHQNYQSNLQRFGKNSHMLYQLLMKPIVDALEVDVEKLIIIPDSKLSRIPFESLITEFSDDHSSFHELDYLIRDYSISYSLSSRLFASGNQAETSRKGAGLLGIGYTGESLATSRSELGSLPGTVEEINFLRENIPGDYFLGDEGTKSRFLTEASRYNVLHIAVHGISDSTDRFNSRLIFNGLSDNILKTNDLYIADFNARLAVLSACESGLGEINTGEGTFSIARGFSLTGIPSIVMSLWKVNDLTASKIMTDFHKSLLEDNSVSTALRESKQLYLEKSDRFTSHPYFWSAFISMGEDLQVYENKKPPLSRSLFLFLALGIVLTTIFLIKKSRQKKLGTKT